MSRRPLPELARACGYHGVVEADELRPGRPRPVERLEPQHLRPAPARTEGLGPADATQVRARQVGREHVIARLVDHRTKPPGSCREQPACRPRVPSARHAVEKPAATRRYPGCGERCTGHAGRDSRPSGAGLTLRGEANAASAAVFAPAPAVSSAEPPFVVVPPAPWTYRARVSGR